MILYVIVVKITSKPGKCWDLLYSAIAKSFRSPLYQRLVLMFARQSSSTASKQRKKSQNDGHWSGDILHIIWMWYEPAPKKRKTPQTG